MPACPSPVSEGPNGAPILLASSSRVGPARDVAPALVQTAVIPLALILEKVIAYISGHTLGTCDACEQAAV
jgi:hypothetical protein